MYYIRNNLQRQKIDKKSREVPIAIIGCVLQIGPIVRQISKYGDSIVLLTSDYIYRKSLFLRVYSLYHLLFSRVYGVWGFVWDNYLFSVPLTLLYLPCYQYVWHSQYLVWSYFLVGISDRGCLSHHGRYVPYVWVTWYLSSRAHHGIWTLMKLVYMLYLSLCLSWGTSSRYWDPVDSRHESWVHHIDPYLWISYSMNLDQI